MEQKTFQIDKLVGIQQEWARKPIKFGGEGSAKRYSSVVLVVTIFVCSEGGGGGQRKWYIENKNENKVEE